MGLISLIFLELFKFIPPFEGLCEDLKYVMGEIVHCALPHIFNPGLPCVEVYNKGGIGNVWATQNGVQYTPFSPPTKL